MSLESSQSSLRQRVGDTDAHSVELRLIGSNPRMHHWVAVQALPADPEQILGAIKAKFEVGSQLLSACSSCKRAPGDGSGFELFLDMGL